MVSSTAIKLENTFILSYDMIRLGNTLRETLIKIIFSGKQLSNVGKDECEQGYAIYKCLFKLLEKVRYLVISL